MLFACQVEIQSFKSKNTGKKPRLSRFVSNAIWRHKTEHLDELEQVGIVFETAAPFDTPQLMKVLLDRPKEAAPGRTQLLTRPRQVGKTTLLLEIVAQFGDRAVYAAGDEPDAALPGFSERCWADAERCTQHATAVLLLDEVHHLSDWAV
jgi:predicted AAA+ superfamily ATPase